MSEFRVGDAVRVVKKVESRPDWEDGWVDEMNEYLDKVGTVAPHRNYSSYSTHGAKVLFRDGASFNFHPSSLEYEIVT